MAELEKVIMGLECCEKDGSFCYDKKCPYKKNFPKCIQSLMDDALSLMKAQEPRVMTLKEIVSAECVWIEYATSGNIIIALPWDIELTDDTYNFIGMPNCFVEFRSLYDQEWRCWTSRATDEQRAVTPWSEPPKEG